MVKRARAGKGHPSQPQKSYLELVGTEYRIPVPEDPNGERAAVVADPEFQRRLAAARQDRAEGRTIASDRVFDVDAEFEPQAAHAVTTAQPGRGRPAAGAYKGRFLVRVPASLHRELVERAAQEHTTLNQLVLSYLSRGLGADTGR
jgi:predicted HicB family RNase H-like nuclease